MASPSWDKLDPILAKSDKIKIQIWKKKKGEPKINIKWRGFYENKKTMKSLKPFFFNLWPHSHSHSHSVILSLSLSLTLSLSLKNYRISNLATMVRTKVQSIMTQTNVSSFLYFHFSVIFFPMCKWWSGSFILFRADSSQGRQHNFDDEFIGLLKP